MKKYIAIIDFGSQYTHLIARRVRELGVESRIYSNETVADELHDAYGLILSGGPKSIVQNGPLTHDGGLFELGIPILGLCYGHQLLGYRYGGRLARGTAREYGVASLNIGKSPIFNDIPSTSNVWMSHGEHIQELPEGFKKIAETGNGSIAAMSQEDLRMYGFQFHPEVHHTQYGTQMLKNFVFNICKAEKNWTTDNQLKMIQQNILNEAGRKNVFLLLSGGVDSTVCFALLEKTLGKNRVYGLHIDHGMMRKNESKKIKKMLSSIGIENLHVHNAETEFLTALAGVFDPELKRKIIGNLFIDIANRVMADLQMNESNWLLGQGTIYPDTIESGGTKNADNIKTHHNRVDRIRKMIADGLIIEPIKDLYKDEVRAIGRQLRLPAALVDRHPFPGPGLAVRCLCSEGGTEVPYVIEHFDVHLQGIEGKPSNRNNDEVTFAAHNGERDPFSRDSEVRSVSRNEAWHLPVKSVGVQGDERSYAHPAVLVGNYRLSHLKKISPAITNHFHDVNRVLGLIFGDPAKLGQATMHRADVNKKRLSILAEIDEQVNDIVRTDPNWNNIWQMPIVLIPFGHTKKNSLVIRPVESSEAMTVSFARIHPDTLLSITKNPLIFEQVDYIFYDLTNKPPGTIEWE